MLGFPASALNKVPLLRAARASIRDALKGLRKAVGSFISGSSPPQLEKKKSLTQTEKMYSICYVTAPTMEVAKKIAHGLVSSRLAACANIVPGITSVYHWKGKIEEDSELLLMIKTQTPLVPQVIDAVRGLHPYEVPEVISVPITAGYEDYLAWIGANTGPLSKEAPRESP